MELVFVRHGESMGNVWGGAYDDDRTNFLSLKGIKQAELSAYTVGELIAGIDTVITSNLTRSMQTATTIMQTLGDWKREYTIDARLNEWCYDADGHDDWFLDEPSGVFWARIESFYDDVLAPLYNTDGHLMIVSHYYTMFALFHVMRERSGMSNKVGEPMDPHNDGGIPNAIPFYFNTKNMTGPEIILPGHRDRNR